MSRNEWESGTLKIPTAEWAGLKRAVRDAHNKRQGVAYLEALDIYNRLIAEAKGKRGFKWGARFGEMLGEHVGSGWGSQPRYRNVEFHQAFRTLWPKAKDWSPASASRPNKPQKAHFPLASATTLRFGFSEATIEFDEKSHEVSWSVEENNHACDDAHAHPLAKALFEALAKVKWTRGSGGVIVGNDEYNRDSRESGGGANYVKDAFGPGGQFQLNLSLGLTVDGRVPRRRRTRVAA